MAYAKSLINITKSHDLLACLGIAMVSYGCTNQIPDVFPSFMLKAFETGCSRAILGFAVHAIYRKGSFTIKPADSYAYWAVTAVCESAARHYSNQDSKSYIALTCIYYATNFIMECLTRKVSGYQYIGVGMENKQNELLLSSSAASALVKTAAAMAGEFIPVALGFTDPGLIKFIIQTGATAATKKALNDVLDGTSYGEGPTEIKL